MIEVKPNQEKQRLHARNRDDEAPKMIDSRIIQEHTREEMQASSSEVTRFVVEIPNDTAALRDMVVEDIQDLISPIYEFVAERFHSVQFLASDEDRTALLEFSTGLLIVHWLLSSTDKILSQVVALNSGVSYQSDQQGSPKSKFMFKFVNLVDTALANIDAFTSDPKQNFTFSTECGDASVIGGHDEGTGAFCSSSIGSGLVDSIISSSISPKAVMVIAPIIIITLTCIMADNEYHLFATIFAPMVDRFLGYIRMIIGVTTIGGNNRRIPEEEETSEGMLWGIILLFCLETLLVGCIVFLMVLVSIGLTLLSSLPELVSSDKDQELLLEDVSKILIGLLGFWIICVLMTNVIRMVLYQTIYDEQLID